MLTNYFISSQPQDTLEAGNGIGEAIASESIQPGQPIYLLPTGECALAAATGFPRCEVIGIAISAANATQAVYYSSDTMVGINSWAASNGSILLTMGSTYYLGTTPGQITATPPQSEFKIILGKAHSSSVLDIEIKVPSENIYESAVNISAYKLVGLNADGKLIIADATLQILPIGILLQNVSIGEKTIVTIQNTIYSSTWAWTPNKTLFLADNGSISLTPATVGLFAPVGKSVSNNLINFDATLEHYYLA